MFRVDGQLVPLKDGRRLSPEEVARMAFGIMNDLQKDKFKTTKGNCYEIYGKDKAGQKVEIYYNPVDGSIVKEKRA